MSSPQSVKITFAVRYVREQKCHFYKSQGVWRIYVFGRFDASLNTNRRNFKHLRKLNGKGFIL